MMYNDFLFELGCEELPFASVQALAVAFAHGLVNHLEKLHINHGNVKSFATPRRIGLLIQAMQEEQPSRNICRRGPGKDKAYDKDGNPTLALLGFAKSCKVSVEALTSKKNNSGEWITYESQVAGGKAKDYLPKLINEILLTLPIIKSMRWGCGNIQFIRPVHWVVMLLGEEVIACKILGITTNRVSYGHRFHAPQKIIIKHPAQYESLLYNAYVIADFGLRRTLIKEQMEAIVNNLQAKVIMPESLLDEVAAIVEWPKALLATFKPEFLQMPPEILRAAMQVHQKSFAIADNHGRLLPHFITIANIESKEPQQVIKGNEKVMCARLNDAVFFLQQDQKCLLEKYLPLTKQVVFQLKLGTLYEKAERIKLLLNQFSTILNINQEEAKRVAELSKCDLVTGMVGEFPELEGIMGYYYALHSGEKTEVAIALKEQYMPRFADDQLPSSVLGCALSLFDRIDTLVGIFAIGLKPSGMKDPFKLRRHALAVARILINISAQLKLSQIITAALNIYTPKLGNFNTVLEDLKNFIFERLQSYYHKQGMRNDVFHAVQACQNDWLYDFDKRMHALSSYLTTPEIEILKAINKRVNNILSSAPQNISIEEVDEMKFLTEAEKLLFTKICEIEKIFTQEKLFAKDFSQNYIHKLSKLVSLYMPINNFFDQVMVMVNDAAIKQNRLCLLIRLRNLLYSIADFSLLQN